MHINYSKLNFAFQPCFCVNLILKEWLKNEMNGFVTLYLEKGRWIWLKMDVKFALTGRPDSPLYDVKSERATST